MLQANEEPAQRRDKAPGGTGTQVSAPSAAGPVAPTPPPHIPDHELLHPIGRGAYGEVWLARTVLDEWRAVKIVRRDAFGNDPRPFEREFEGIRRFEPISRSDPSQVAILHVGRAADGSHFYYVMELADDSNAECGTRSAESDADAPVSIPHSTLRTPHSYAPHTLRSDLRTRARLPVARVVELGLALTQALGHLHKKGLVHRDVKPSNIIFVGGRPKLADIGLVTQAASGDDTRSIVGTEGYLSPEGPGTPQADLYALGKVLYEAAMGRDRRDFPDLPLGWPDVPERAALLELNEIIVKACAADARERYQSADQMRADLELLLEGRSVKRRRTWRQSRRLMLQFGAAATVIIAAWFALNRFNDLTLQRSNASTPATIFVLPFRNDGTNYNGLTARATDALIDSLKLISGVTVAPRQEELGRSPEAEARAEAAERFDVRYVLAGNVKTGGTNTLALTLHDLPSDRVIWSNSFTGTMERWVPMQTEAVHALAKALDVAITPDAEPRIGQKLSNNLAAWKLVQQAGKVSYSAREEVSAALQQYNEALQLDPDYADALAGKAQLLRNLAGDAAPNSIWPEIKLCGKRMLQIDSSSSMGEYFLWVTKFLFEWDWEEAERIFQERRARHLDGPLMTAFYLRMMGRFDEARVEQEKVKGLDQRDVSVRSHSTSAAFVERDYRKTIEMAREFQAVLPGSGYGWDWFFHGYYHLGQFEQALETIRQRRRVYDEPLSMALEACALAKMGQREAARKLLVDLEAKSDRYVDAYPLAWIHLALGDKPAALAKLRQACQQRSEFLVCAEVLAGGLRIDPKLDELRDEPEFQEILKLAGLDVWPKPAAVK